MLIKMAFCRLWRGAVPRGGARTIGREKDNRLGGYPIVLHGSLHLPEILPHDDQLHASCEWLTPCLPIHFLPLSGARRGALPRLDPSGRSISSHGGDWASNPVMLEHKFTRPDFGIPVVSCQRAADFRRCGARGRSEGASPRHRNYRV
jgi:hypothetical protein